jgi:hypothetical protein
MFVEDTIANVTVVTTGQGNYMVKNSCDRVIADYSSSLLAPAKIEAYFPAGERTFGTNTVTLSHSVYSGSFLVHSSLNKEFVQTWNFDGLNNVWSDSQTGDTWQYDPLIKLWTQGNNGWLYDDQQSTWFFNEADNGWVFNQTTGFWEYDDGEVVWHWHYLWFSNTWRQITDHSGLPDGGLPPTVVVQKTIVDLLFNAVRLAGAFDVGAGLYGWQEFSALGNQTWKAANADARYYLVYAGDAQTINISGVSEHETYSYSLVDGSFEWFNIIDADDHVITWYDAASGNWHSDFSEQPIWNYQQNSGIWTRIEDSITWVLSGINQWTSSESDVSWVYAPTQGTWTELANNSVWQYEVAGNYWRRISGDGLGVTQDSFLPPLPLVQQQYMNSAVYAAMALGADFLIPSSLSYELNNFDEMRPNAYRAALNGAYAEIDFAPTDQDPYASFVRNDTAIRWTFNLATHDWHWTNQYDDNNYSASLTTVIRSGVQAQVWSDSTNQTSEWFLDTSVSGRLGWHSGNESWYYNSATSRWYNVVLQHEWSYEPSSLTWANTTTQQAYKMNDRTAEWEQVFGPLNLSSLPPKVVRQHAFIAAIVDALFHAGKTGSNTAAFEDSFIAQENHEWVLTACGVELRFTPSSWPYQFTFASTVSDPVAELMQVQFSLQGRWRIFNGTNILSPKEYVYDPLVGRWHNTVYDSHDSWTYNTTTKEWLSDANQAIRWQYDEHNKNWISPNGQQWSYDYSSGMWQVAGSDGLWVYDLGIGRWIAYSQDQSVAVFPPPVVVAINVFKSLFQKFIEAEALHMGGSFEWSSSDYAWRGIDRYSSGIGEYDARHQVPYYWADCLGRNQVSYSQMSGEWLWSLANQQRLIEKKWSYDSDKKYWSEQTRITGGWFYYFLDGQYSWISHDDPLQRWRKQSEASWYDEVNGKEWRYYLESGLWGIDGNYWGYNFVHDLWYSIEVNASVPAAFPPLPLLQQLFLSNLAASANQFLAQPLYAGVREAHSTYRHPLYGSRPLRSGAFYDRYNAGTILVNAPLTLDGVWFVHTDVARNLGKLQVPRVDERALPAIIGGERASLEGAISGPPIILKDATIACHESLVAAGVRFVVTERTEGAASSVLEDANNHSAIVTYQRGRALDAPQRRGTVFQLGSTANTMINGTQEVSVLRNDLGELTSSSLRDSFIDIYRSQEVVAACSVNPVQIQLSLCSASEVGVATASRATRILFLAHESRVSIGWPTPYGSVQYFPWEIPLDQPLSLNDQTVFALDDLGNGCLHVGGASWCISARNSVNSSPSYPVTKADQPGVVYVDYGGLVTAQKNADLVLDTVMAVRMSNQEPAGAVTIPSDQLELSPQGRVQGYGADFAANQGNIAVARLGSNFATGRPFQAPTIPLVKGRQKRRK